jgi:hypothetical protein
MAYRLGVDVGGTFTDLLLFDNDNGSFWRHKTPSTPHAGIRNILTLDVGGTSSDVALIENLDPRRVRTTEVGHLAVRASSLDVKTVGAGGESIAYVPELTGALRVGPQSAGAVPGPVAYGKGGKEPTFTDANVVLGYLPESLLGGTFKLDREGAKKAVREWFQLFQIGFGGIPRRPFGDGPDGHSLWPNFTNVPNEFLERYFPLVIERYETVADSGGGGWGDPLTRDPALLAKEYGQGLITEAVRVAMAWCCGTMPSIRRLPKRCVANCGRSAATRYRRSITARTSRHCALAAWRRRGYPRRASRNGSPPSSPPNDGCEQA